MPVCRHGMFVGVDKFGDMGEAYDLRASAGATRLASFFREQDSAGQWIPIIETGRRVLRRNDVIVEFCRWLASVPADGAGLFYYGGHGVTTEPGLVLAGRDFNPSVPYDTGIPIDRLVNIAGQSAPAGAHIVFLLDCCRNVVTKRPVKLVAPPDRIGLLYACEQGSVASERGGQSLFVNALIQAASTAPLKRLDGRSYVPLRSLTEGLVQSLAEDPSCEQVANYVGTEADVLLPASTLEPLRTDSLAPTALLETRAMGAAALSASKVRIQQAFQKYLGYAPADLAGVIQVIGFEESDGMLSVRLPMTGAIFRPRDFFGYLLNTCHSMFVTLHIIWPARVPEPSFRMLSSSLGLDYAVVKDGEELLLKTSVGTAALQAVISLGEETTLLLSHRSREGDQLFLDDAVDVATKVYDRLAAVRVRGTNAKQE